MRGLAWLVGALIGASVVTAGAQSASYSGGNDYQVYCSSCHGSTGKGDGSIAKSLQKPPADLTQLTKLNNGVFPAEKVFKTIDGRTPGSAHSDSDMPVWGDVFAKSSESQGADNAALRIRTLVAHMETLQAKPSAIPWAHGRVVNAVTGRSNRQSNASSRYRRRTMSSRS